MDFNKSIFENRKSSKYPFIASHRGVCGANIPCNTMASFKIAVDGGAEVIELDVTKSRDREFFVFHPGTEPVFLKCGKYIKDMDAEEVKSLRLLNQDETKTSYKIETLYDVLLFLKDKVYINVDKFWTDVKGISEVIRRAGVEKQVIVKTPDKPEYLEAVAKYAPDFMFVPIVSEVDNATERLIEMGVNVIGTEVIFKSDDSPVISDEYIKSMHDRGLLVWANAIIYDERAVISAHHTDDISLTESPEKGWGWLIDKNVDFIQTDWLHLLKAYIQTRG